MVVLVELAYEDKVDFVLAKRRPICPIMVGHRWPRWTRHDNGPATRQGQTLPTGGGGVVKAGPPSCLLLLPVLPPAAVADPLFPFPIPLFGILVLSAL